MRSEDYAHFTELADTIAGTFTRINELATKLAGKSSISIKSSGQLRRFIVRLYLRAVRSQDEQAVDQTVLQELERHYLILLRLEAEVTAIRSRGIISTRKRGEAIQIRPDTLRRELARYDLLSRFTLAGAQSDSELANNSREYRAASLRLEVGDIAFFFFERLVNEIEKDDRSIPPTFWLAIQQWRCQGISAKARRSIQGVGSDLIVSEGRLNSPAPVYFVAHKDRRETKACNRPALVQILRQWGIIRIE